MRLTDLEIIERTDNYIRSILPANPSFDQYARWAKPVCVKVSGIADTCSSTVANRVRIAATDAGIALAGAGCKPNLLVVFSFDARQTAAVIVRRRPAQIARLNGTEIDRLLNAPLPVNWGHVFDLGESGGIPAGPGGSALMTPIFQGGRSLADILGGTPVTQSYNSSLIDTHITVGVSSAVAVVDIPLATGTSLDALADYVAMVMLAL